MSYLDPSSTSTPFMPVERRSRLSQRNCLAWAPPIVSSPVPLAEPPTLGMWPRLSWWPRFLVLVRSRHFTLPTIGRTSDWWSRASPLSFQLASFPEMAVFSSSRQSRRPHADIEGILCPVSHKLRTFASLILNMAGHDASLSIDAFFLDAPSVTFVMDESHLEELNRAPSPVSRSPGNERRTSRSPRDIVPRPALQRTVSTSRPM